MEKLKSIQAHTFIVCLKGTSEALHQAYRRSLRMLAEFDMNYSIDSAPDYVSWEWKDITGYRVFTVKSDGMGYNCDFSDISGLEEYIWVIHNSDALIAQSNDYAAVILSRKEDFGIPEGKYEIL